MRNAPDMRIDNKEELAMIKMRWLERFTFGAQDFERSRRR